MVPGLEIYGPILKSLNRSGMWLQAERARGVLTAIEALWEEDLSEFLTDGHGSEVRFLVRNFENFRKSSAGVEDLAFEAKVVADRTWEKLNTGKWADVAEERKQVYAIASFIRIVALLHQNEGQVLKKCLEITDLGILLGFPFRSLSLTKVADILSSSIEETSETIPTPSKKARLSAELKKPKLANEIGTVSRPSLEYFRRNHLEKRRPVKVRNCLGHWPALELWKEPGYIVAKAGHRTVPVELGKHYADGSYSQKLMKVSEFVREFFGEDAREIGYLAQHQLFDQVPELKKDIKEPDYCALSENPESGGETEINAWFGPKGTVSPLHFDPKHNLLCQVVGTKKILLVAPECSQFLYPHDDALLFNTSRVDAEDPDFDQFPEFRKAVVEECLLEPGEMLYIPPKYWHHVRALENSFSVSFWWE